RREPAAVHRPPWLVHPHRLPLRRSPVQVRRDAQGGGPAAVGSRCGWRRGGRGGGRGRPCGLSGGEAGGAGGVYGPSTVKRARRTRAALDALDEAIYRELAEERPASVRHVFYRMTTLPVGVEKTEAGYRCVQRRLLALRRAGIVPYGWVSDNTRWRVKPDSHGS